MCKSVILFLLCIFCIVITAVRADCEIPRSENSPLFVRNFGTKKILIKATENSIELNEGEKVKAICPGEFVKENRYGISCENQYFNDIYIKCKNNRLFINCFNNRDYSREINSNSYIRCENPSSRYLYESNVTLPNCENFTSLAIGLAIENIKDIVTANLCYDWDTLSLKYITFNTMYKNENYWNDQVKNAIEITEKNRNYLFVKLDSYNSYFPFLSQRYFNETMDAKKITHQYLSMFNFDFVSLIGQSKLNTELHNFENILNLIWWRNLRESNWQLFLDALQKQTDNRNYTITMGYSGKMQLPATACNTNAFVSIKYKEIITYAPKYIWTHVKSLTNDTDNYVVVGVNTPFIQLNENLETLCEDVCEEIEWLQSKVLLKVRNIPTMGLIFCCKPEDVPDIFVNFPKNKINNIKSSTTQIP